MPFSTSTCSATFDDATSVSLTATTSNSDFLFDGYAVGPGTVCTALGGGANGCQLTVDGDESVTVTYKEKFNLSLSFDGELDSVSVSPAAVGSETSVEKGRQLYLEGCSSCHGMQGQGAGTGPNSEISPCAASPGRSCHL